MGDYSMNKNNFRPVSILSCISYLFNRKQRVKIGSFRSEWLNLKKGVPQGPILGPFLFNIFLNDIFYTLNGIYNYADDNTISRYGDDIGTVKIILEDATHEALDWFSCKP